MRCTESSGVLFDTIDMKLREYATKSVYDPKKFFKTDEGSYAAHDRFIGIKVPVLRLLALQYKDLCFKEISRFLYHEYNEYRLFGLFVLIGRYDTSNNEQRHYCYQFYMDHLFAINNWNLVDSSAHVIVGRHVYDGLASESVFDDLIQSTVLWHRRIAVVATWYYIRKKSLILPIKFLRKLLQDDHDLIHKAVGWMLRELGKRDESLLRDFLKNNKAKMHRTTYRYAIEKMVDLGQLLK